MLKKGARAVARDGFTPFSSTSLSFSSLLYIVRCENSSFCLVKKSSAGERCRVSEWALGFHSVLLHDNRMFSAKAESDEGWDDVMLRGAPDDEAALSRSSRPNHTPRGWRRRRNNNIMRVEDIRVKITHNDAPVERKRFSHFHNPDALAAYYRRKIGQTYLYKRDENLCASINLPLAGKKAQCISFLLQM
jgi:hypothetical protein